MISPDAADAVAGPPVCHEAELLTLPDGRTLSYCKFGSSTPSHFVFYFHSYPASRLEGALLDNAAASQDMQLICPDRPGMGSSTYSAQRQLLDWPLDVLALADHLGIAKFACIGVSGGGPYVLACYHKIPRHRLLASAVVAGLWPRSLGTGGMLLELRLMLFLGPWVPGLVAAGIDHAMGNMARDAEHPERFSAAVAEMLKSRPEVDQAVWNANPDGYQQKLLGSLREALRVDAKGAAHEVKLYGSDWGFSLQDIQVQENTLLIFHGDLDKNVPVAMAQKAAAQLPGCTLEVFPEGHASLIVGKATELLVRVKAMMN